MTTTHTLRMDGGKLHLSKPTLWRCGGGGGTSRASL